MHCFDSGQWGTFWDHIKKMFCHWMATQWLSTPLIFPSPFTHYIVTQITQEPYILKAAPLRQVQYAPEGIKLSASNDWPFLELKKVPGSVHMTDHMNGPFTLSYTILIILVLNKICVFNVVNCVSDTWLQNICHVVCFVPASFQRFSDDVFAPPINSIPALPSR